jgi:peptidoglycan/LPS O-acetylase OafA/YrhL
VLGTAAVIAAGSAAAGVGAELLLRPRPVQWLGKRSFALYLWHWPILIIAMEHAGHALELWQNLLLVLVAVAASAISYWLVENPIRHSTWLGKRPVVTVAFGLCLIGATLGVAQWEIHAHSGPNGLREPGTRGELVSSRHALYQETTVRLP